MKTRGYPNHCDTAILKSGEGPGEETNERLRDNLSKHQEERKAVNNHTRNVAAGIAQPLVQKIE